MTLVRRRIRLTFDYGTGASGIGPTTSASLEDLRCTAHVTIAGGRSMGELQLRVYGMPLSMMNQLSTLGVPVSVVRKNTVTVEAGDQGGSFAKIYQGTIYSAWADMDASPDVAFEVVAHAGLVEAMQPIPPFSAQGGVDAATALEQLAGKMGATFENNGVSGINLSNHYSPGTAWTQALEIAQAAGVELVYDNGVLAAWPRGGNRQGAAVTIDKDTGMVGYPSYTANGLMVRALFNPSVKFGALVQISSTALPTSSGQAQNQAGRDLLPVDGQWKVSTLVHDLSAEYPGGPWFTEMQLVAPGLISVGR